MEIVGIIALVIVILLAFSLLGWGLKILGWIFDFLSEGSYNSRPPATYIAGGRFRMSCVTLFRK